MALEANDNDIMKGVFQTSGLILISKGILVQNASVIKMLLPEVTTTIVDDAHAMLEPETLIMFKLIKTSQLILVGQSTDVPLMRQTCYSENVSVTQFSKSCLERMVEQDFNFLKARG